jgi:NAD(P)-dependent dehydrogenase (short-subunit alcohol dehydrogenase family)
VPGQRTTLVTGAAKPYGVALVRACLERGDRVIAAARNPARVPILADLRAEHGRLELIALDPADAASVADAVPIIESLTSALDCLLIAPAEPGAHERVSDAERDAHLHTLSGTGLLEHYHRTALAPVLRTMLAFGTAQAVLALAALGFSGVGVSPPTAELGAMMTEYLPHYHEAPWLIAAPVGLLMAVVLGMLLLSPDDAE